MCPIILNAKQCKEIKQLLGQNIKDTLAFNQSSMLLKMSSSSYSSNFSDFQSTRINHQHKHTKQKKQAYTKNKAPNQKKSFKRMH
jgi:mannitol-specific phosphotransferase system IIBC component